MGYIAHHAIIVTAWDSVRLEKARAKALELGMCCTEVVESKINGYATFLVPPDGSKEGWQDSDAGDNQRAAWIKWTRETPELWVDWVLVRYGGDEPDLSTIVNHSGNDVVSG